MIDGKDRGILVEMQMCQYESFFYMFFRNVDFCYFDWLIDVFIIKGFFYFILRNFFVNDGDIFFLKDLYVVIYVNVEIFVVCNICRLIDSVNFFGNFVGIKKGRSNRFLMIIVYWVGENGYILLFENMNFKFRSG